MIDVVNLAEAIESVGREKANAVGSYLALWCLHRGGAPCGPAVEHLRLVIRGEAKPSRTLIRQLPVQADIEGRSEMCPFVQICQSSLRSYAGRAIPVMLVDQALVGHTGHHRHS